MTEPTAPTQAAPRRSLKIGLWAGGVVAVIFTLFSAIATPKFLSSSCRAKESEAKGNLKALFVSEQQFFHDHDSFSSDFSQLTYQGHGSRYIVGFSPTALSPHTPDHQARALIERLTATARTDVLSAAGATQTSFLAFAMGNLDDDDTLDVWTIDEQSRLTHVVADCAQ
jgi:type IV pilus assembly protein PilA